MHTLVKIAHCGPEDPGAIQLDVFGTCVRPANEGDFFCQWWEFENAAAEWPGDDVVFITRVVEDYVPEPFDGLAYIRDVAAGRK